MMMAFSLLKLKHYSIHISSAGMPPIYIYSASNKQVNEINLMGMPLGAMLNFPFRDVQIQVAKDPEFKEVLMDVDGVTETQKKIRLDDYSDYYFRVRSIALDQFKGVWSETIEFTFLEPPRTPPVEAPQMDESQINLRWQDGGQDISYHFQLATDPLFKDIIKDSLTEKPSISFKKPEKSGTYHIRISAIDSQGYEGQFTPAQTFQIKESPLWGLGAIISVIALIIIL